jgi:hypothetical protein
MQNLWFRLQPCRGCGVLSITYGRKLCQLIGGAPGLRQAGLQKSIAKPGIAGLG